MRWSRTFGALAALLATGAACAGSCEVYSEGFDGAGPVDFDGGGHSVRWCANGTTSSSSFCGTGGAWRLASTADDLVLAVDPAPGCGLVTLTFDYAQFTSTLTLLEAGTQGDPDPGCRPPGLSPVLALLVDGGSCTTVTHSLIVASGETAVWRFDHGGVAGAAIFIDNVRVSVTGCCDGDHDCCTTGGPGCSDAGIARCVCAIDPYCCDVEWDEICVAQVASLGCGTCDAGGDCTSTFEVDFGSTFVPGSVCDSFPDLFTSCSGTAPTITSGTACGGSGDYAMTFAGGFPYSAAETRCLDLTALTAPRLRFAYAKTSGSLGPAIEVTLDGEAWEAAWVAPISSTGCVDAELDLTPWQGSSVRLRFASGTVSPSGLAFDDIALVDGAIDHDCCTTGNAGCNDPQTAACVCEIDPFCCETAWDELCVVQAEFYGCTDCGLCLDALDVDFGETFTPGSVCEAWPDLFSACGENPPTVAPLGACGGDDDQAMLFGTGDVPSSVELRCVSIAEATSALLHLRYAKADGTMGPVVEVSLDGGSTWTEIWTAPIAPGAGCRPACIPLDDYVGIPYLNLRLRAGSAAPGGQWIDDVALVIDAPCPTSPDLDGDGSVGFGDILTLLAFWGEPGGPGDLDGDGSVGFADLLMLLASWG